MCAGKTVMLPVQLTDGRSVTVEADSSLTAAEACRHIATDIALRDQFGFAVYISLYDRVATPHLTSPWRFSVAVTRWSRSTQLLYIEPG